MKQLRKKSKSWKSADRSLKKCLEMIMSRLDLIDSEIATLKQKVHHLEDEPSSLIPSPPAAAEVSSREKTHHIKTTIELLASSLFFLLLTTDRKGNKILFLKMNLLKSQIKMSFLISVHGQICNLLNNSQIFVRESRENLQMLSVKLRMINA
jgi:hypothetical protein